VDELVALAAEVGLDPDQLRQALTDRTYAQAVAEDISTARQLGVTGVPFFVIEDKYAVAGAQDSEVFVAALRRAAEESASAPARR
jgi:predicted DsbA family dithiol-disulfide isomerase